MIFDTIIIGGGISGLTSALILARHGRRVAVVEQAKEPAPLVRGFHREGIYFDSAFHYAGGFGEGEVLDLFCRYLGLNEKLTKVPLSDQSYDVFRDSETGREIAFRRGVAALRESFSKSFPEQAVGIAGYLSDLEHCCRTLPFLNLEASAVDWNIGAAMQGPSLAEVLAGRIGNPELRHLFSLHTLLHGVFPQEVSFAFHAGVAVPYYHSACRLAGGGRSLAAAFVGQLAVSGVQVFLGRGVKRLCFSSAGSLSGVELGDGETLACRECLVSIHPRRFLDLVPEGALRPAYRKRLMNLEETVSGYVLFLSGPRRPQLLAASNLYLGPFGSGTDGRLQSLERRPLFVSGAAPAPGSGTECGWTVICPADWGEMGIATERGRGGEEAYLAAKEAVVGRIVQRLKREAPEIVDGARVVAAATPLTLRDYCGGPRGGIYGVKHGIGQYNPQAATRIPGVYLCGQATAAPGLLGTMVSAFLACGQIFGHERLRGEVLAWR
ncbi:MAG: NAD(P)/FAD-dependent oxidoreductase [Deltaproteobacteria bacterium]|nr:NAD(P)/FAD-dependent oxidoreductase [Deltaproteobacteria bacterium]